MQAVSARRRPSFLSSTFRVFDLSVGEMLWSRRTIFMALVAAGPVLIAASLRLLAVLGVQGLQPDNLRVAGPTIFGLMIWLFYLRFTVPVLGVFYGTALIADEVEDKTITYLFSRPVPRGAILMGKYVAYLVCTGLVVLPSVTLVYLLVAPVGGSLGGAFPALVVDLGLLGIGLAVYGAVFAWIGAQVKRPLLIGLLFIIGWEPLVLLLPGYLKNFTIAHYLQSFVPHAMPQDSPATIIQAIFHTPPPVLTSFLALALIWAAMLLLGIRAVERREYVLEQ